MDNKKDTHLDIFNFTAKVSILTFFTVIFLTTILKLISLPISRSIVLLILLFSILVILFLIRIPFNKGAFFYFAKHIVKALLILFIVVISLNFILHKFWIAEHDYLSEESWEIFSRMDFQDELIEKNSINLIKLNSLRSISENKYAIESPFFTISYHNSSNAVLPIGLKYILQNISNEELDFQVFHDNTLIYTGKIPAAYEQTQHYHDYDANNLILSLPIKLNNGENIIRFQIRSDSQISNSDLSEFYIYDFSLLKKKEFYRSVNRYFIVGDQADVRESLNIIRNLKSDIYLNEKVPIIEQTKMGMQKVPSFSNFPVFYYLCSIFTIIFGDNLMIFNVLFAVFLTGILMMCHTYIVNSQLLRQDSLFVYGILLGVSLNIVLILNRWGIESYYEECLLTFFYMIFLRAIKKTDTFLIVSYGVVVSLTKSYGFILVMMPLIYLVFFGENKQFYKTCFLRSLNVLMALAVVYFTFILKFGYLEVFLSEMSLEYNHRFDLLRLFPLNIKEILSLYFQKYLKLIFLLIWAGCFIGVFTNIKTLKKNPIFVYVPLLFILFLTFLNGFRIYYLFPVVFFPVILGISRIIQISNMTIKRSIMALVFIMVICCLFTARNVTADYTGNQNNKIPVYSQTVYDKSAIFLRNVGEKNKANSIFVQKGAF